MIGDAQRYRHVLLLYNAPSLPADHPDYAQEAGVLDAVAAVESALTKAGITIELCGICTLDELVSRLRQSPRPDVVFNFCEGFGGRGDGEAQVAELLEMHSLPFTGSPSTALKLARDKVATKCALEQSGIATPPYVYVPFGSSAPRDALEQLLSGGPVFVKPASEDASLGINGSSVCHTLERVIARIEVMSHRYNDVLVERFITGREFNVSVLALPEIRVLPLAEIVFAARLPQEDRIVSYDAKWASGSEADCVTPVHCPATVTADLAHRVTVAATAAFDIVGCRQYGRIDLRVNEHDEIFMLEVNANPDISPTAGLARALAATGTPLAEFFCTLAEEAVASFCHLAKV